MRFPSALSKNHSHMLEYVVETVALASSVFESFDRRWKMMFQDHTIHLVYSQGLEKIVVALWQVLT